MQVARPGATLLVHRHRNNANAAPTILRFRFVTSPRNTLGIPRRRASRDAQACRRIVDAISMAVH
jgi:hypothetical protein